MHKAYRQGWDLATRRKKDTSHPVSGEGHKWENDDVLKQENPYKEGTESYNQFVAGWEDCNLLRG